MSVEAIERLIVERLAERLEWGGVGETARMPTAEEREQARAIRNILTALSDAQAQVAALEGERDAQKARADGHAADAATLREVLKPFAEAFCKAQDSAGIPTSFVKLEDFWSAFTALRPTPTGGEDPVEKAMGLKFCKACLTFPKHGYCNLKGCPMERTGNIMGEAPQS